MGNSNPSPALSGVVGFFDSPDALIEATRKVRAANFESFDCYTPYPVHGLEHAQGLKRSRLPFVTLGAGLTGFMCAVALQYWTSAVDWPLNVGGKPYWSWPAFVPIMFELTVLFAGLATVGAMFIVNGFPNTKKRAFDPNITRDRFAIMVDAPKVYTAEELEDLEPAQIAKIEKKNAQFKKFEVEEVKSFLQSLGASEVKSVEARGWFE
jgi:hypothetical protein